MDIGTLTGVVADGQAKVFDIFTVAVARRAGQRQVCRETSAGFLDVASRVTWTRSVVGLARRNGQSRSSCHEGTACEESVHGAMEKYTPTLSLRGRSTRLAWSFYISCSSAIYTVLFRPALLTLRWPRKKIELCHRSLDALQLTTTATREHVHASSSLAAEPCSSGSEERNRRSLSCLP